MASRRSSFSLLVVCAVIALVAGSRPFEASPAAQNPDTLNALLVEVKGLRAAMEQLASSGPRVQLAFGRLQIHEQRLAGLLRRAGEVRERIRPAIQEEEELRARLARSEAAYKTLPLSGENRKEFEDELRALRRLAARSAYDLQTLQAEEASISGEITAEQARWVQINQQLEELERSFVRR